MKKIFLFLSIVFYLCKAHAQVNYYKGEWTKINSEENFSAFLKLNIKDSIIKDEIIWTFKAIDSADAAAMKYYKGQKEKMGIEYVKGIYSQKTYDIQFEGVSKTDPDLIIGLDKYLLKLSIDRSTIYGRTLSQGENNGLVYFNKSNMPASDKEFNILRSKILLRSGEKALK